MTTHNLSARTQCASGRRTVDRCVARRSDPRANQQSDGDVRDGRRRRVARTRGRGGKEGRFATRKSHGRPRRCLSGRRKGSTQGQQAAQRAPDGMWVDSAQPPCLASSRESLRNRLHSLLVPRSQVRSLPGPSSPERPAKTGSPSRRDHSSEARRCQLADWIGGGGACCTFASAPGERRTRGRHRRGGSCRPSGYFA